MAQNPEVLVDSAAWTQLDSLAGHTLVEMVNKDGAQSIGVLIQASQPSSGIAWTAGSPIPPRGERMWRLATGDHVWARAQTSLQVAGSGTNVYEAV